MEPKVIREMTTPEILERLDEERKQLVKLKLNHAVSPLENPNKIKVYRKTIARLMTELTSRARQEQQNVTASK